jgi:hypothetical protein
MDLIRPFVHPAVDYLLLHARVRYHRVRAGDLSRGASAVEWVVITMILVVLAIGIGAIITRAVTNKANDVESKIDGVD